MIFCWLPEHVETLRRMADEGCTAAVIAKHFGVSRCAVAGKAHRSFIHLKGNDRQDKDGWVKTHRYEALRAANAAKRAAAPKPVIVLKPKPLPKLVRSECAMVNPSEQILQTLAQLDRHGCRWVVEGDHKGAMDEALMCGAPQKEGSAYCAGHHRLAHVPRSNVQAAKDLPAHDGAVRAGQRPGQIRWGIG